MLTDNELTIIALLRNVSEGAEHEQYRLGLTYNLSLRQNYEGVPPLTKERVRNGLQKAVDKQSDESAKASKIKKKPGDALRKALAVSITEFPPVVLDHALDVTGFDKTTLPSQVLENEETLDKLMAVFEEAAKVIASITSADKATGYIVAKRNKPTSPDADNTEEQDATGLMYDDFHPFKPRQLENKPENTFLDFAGFNKTVDEFFSSIEGQKLESKLQEREDNAKKRLEQARQEHEKRIGGLQQVQELNVRRAQAIEANLDRVEEATAAVNGLIAQGMDWVEISRLIEMEQNRHNPVAEMIKLPLKLHENTVTVLVAEYSFPDEDDDMDDLTDEEPSDSDDEESAPSKTNKTEEKRLAVDIDLGLSGWSNARRYYDQRKAAATKQEKTEQASTKALKSTEQRIQADLKKGLKQEKAVLRPVRKQVWFEKFIYFISSDGYLVLGGKDAQQNEILYRRYLKKGDVYVHADLNGAASVIIKNNTSTADAPIPPSTLSQAGNLSVCTSTAWDSKAVMSAWWVNADQVSKTAPTGEYLAAGGFMIRGKKNFLPPAQLLLGFAVMFQISEESKAKHVKHRVKGDEIGAKSDDTQEPADGDSDDDFPDADKDVDGTDEEVPDADTREGSVDDSDDEFPDAQNNDGSEASENEESASGRNNPLQPQGNGAPAGRSEDNTAGESEDSADEADNAEHPESNTTKPAELIDEAPSSMRDLSARERREQRKEAASSKPDPKAPQQPKRGKRSKAKKAAAKYADQDEEDRRIALALLGSRAAEEKRSAAAEAAADKTESVEAAKARRREQHERSQREGLEAEELRRLNLEEGVEPLEEEEAAAMTQLDALVGMPLPGDEILEAIPVCAPWAALGKYKYKIKLQPGAQKKGKAVRELLARWIKAGAEKRNLDSTGMDKERIWPREVELIKGWKEQEIIGVVPVSKVRVMMSGGQSGGTSEAAKGKKTKQRGQKKGKK